MGIWDNIKKRLVDTPDEIEIIYKGNLLNTFEIFLEKALNDFGYRFSVGGYDGSKRSLTFRKNNK